MPQTSYSLEMANAFAGMKAESRFDLVESFIARTAIEFGLGVGAEAGDVEQIQIPRKDVAAMLFDIDFVASNTINITVNGVAMAQVTYNASHTATVNLVKAALEAVTGVTSVTLSDAINNRGFRIETSGAISSVSALVAGGSTQAVATITYSSDDIFRGIALHTHNKETGNYPAKDLVNVLRQGKAWVSVGLAVTADEDAYVDVVNGTGKFTNVNTNNLATGGKFRSTTTGAGIALVEISLP